MTPALKLFNKSKTWNHLPLKKKKKRSLHFSKCAFCLKTALEKNFCNCFMKKGIMRVWQRSFGSFNLSLQKVITCKWRVRTNLKAFSLHWLFHVSLWPAELHAGLCQLTNAFLLSAKSHSSWLTSDCVCDGGVCAQSKDDKYDAFCVQRQPQLK